MKTKTTRAVLVVLLLFAACSKTATDGSPAYHCPMHPTYVSDRPGDCPICGMKLVPIKSEPPGAPAEGRAVLFYRNPMDPSVTSPVPAKDQMGMDYIPVYAKEVLSAKVERVAGLAAVELSQPGARLAGVQTAVATRERLRRTVRAVGVVSADESRIFRVHAKIAGWVERLFVNTTGQPVRRGGALLEIYSPELLATQEEFIRAREAAARFSSSSLPEVRLGGEQLLQNARRRLELFDVPPGFIAELERTDKPRRAVRMLAPASGFVTGKGVFEGQRIEPGTELFTITDLSRVWIEADLYENEARAASVGQEAELELSYDERVRLRGKISYVYPYLNPDTRTLKVRFEFDNPDQVLKPGAFANVELVLESAEGVVVPDDAVMDTGERQVVFVGGEGRTFAPREVEVGMRAGGKALIAAGLAEGERVAVHANFLLDSESRLRSAIEDGK